MKPETAHTHLDTESVRRKVREGYSRIAKTSSSCCGSDVSCCGSTPATSEALARQIGYSVDELAALPDGANLGLSSGNPSALASLQPGEVVLDLGGKILCIARSSSICPPARPRPISSPVWK